MSQCTCSAVGKGKLDGGATLGATGDKGIKLVYVTEWEYPRVRFAREGRGWDEEGMEVMVSGDRWMIYIDAEDGEDVEFVITDTKGNWDNAPGGGDYSVSAPGAYELNGGIIRRLTPAAPILIVSDIDGTMVGDSASTAAFRSLWEGHASVSDSLLVYSTGRSLDSYLKLEAETPVLARPDYLVCGVGTKIFERNRARNGEFEWAENAEWNALIGQGWRLAPVREAGYRLVADGEGNVHFRPPEEQNEYKLTLGVHSSFLSTVIEELDEDMRMSKVKGKVIVSGEGEWRYVDVVPQGAGKLESLEYLRNRHGFSLSNTVACGDSGNDMEMLEGESRGVVVGNAQPDLKKWAKNAKSNEGVGRLFLARETYAAGILEGLEHFGLMSTS